MYTKKQQPSLAELLKASVTKKEQFKKDHKKEIAEAADWFLDEHKLDLEPEPKTAKIKIKLPTTKLTNGKAPAKTLAELMAQTKAKQQEQQNKKSTPHTTVVPVTNVVPTIPKEIKKSIFDQAVEEAQKEFPDIKLDASQSRALNTLIRNQYGCLIGSAGTGKTTVTKFLVRALQNIPQYLAHPPHILACSFTGRAAQVANRSLHDVGIQATTAHSMLGYKPERYWCEKDLKEKMRFVPTYTKHNKLDCDILLIDETGMLPIDLWNNIIDALHRHCRIYLIGDIQQLPPVIGRSVLGYAMLKWPVGGLETIHRQAEGNPIIDNAYEVLHGRMPKPYPGQFNLVTLPDGSLTASQKIIQMVGMLGKQGNFEPETDVIITPQNVGALGQQELNLKLRGFFNPLKKDKSNQLTTIRTARTTTAFAVGDKVMQLQNDHELGVTNGMVGFVKDIRLNVDYKMTQHDRYLNATETLHDDHIDLSKLDFSDAEFEDQSTKEEEIPYAQRQASHVVMVEFENGASKYVNTVGGFNNLAWAYASTCHKCQGGEYRTVIIIVHASMHLLLNREWLYTAITRAHGNVILCANDLNLRGITRAITRQEITGTTLKEKAIMFNALQEKNKGKMKVNKDTGELENDRNQVPMLPQNVELGEDGFDKKYHQRMIEKQNVDEHRKVEIEEAER